MITLADLQAIAGSRTRSRTAIAIVDAFNKHAKRYKITSQPRITLFLAHVSVETGGFRSLSENMSYSAKRMMQVWPRRFKNLAHAKQFERKPQKLANHVYGNRMGNRGKPNAGWLYRGSGPGQVTGYNNFKKIEDETGMPVTSNPDLLRDPDTGMKATMILWDKWHMNAYADKGQITASRKKWNGGTHGLKETKAAYARGMKRDLVSGTPSPKPKPKPKSSDKTRRLQERLKVHGLNPGPIDGIWGEKTQSALRSFQKAKGLVVDGIAGPRTWAALNAHPVASRSAPEEELPPIPEKSPPKSSKGPVTAFLLAVGALIAWFWEWVTETLCFWC